MIWLVYLEYIYLFPQRNYVLAYNDMFGIISKIILCPTIMTFIMKSHIDTLTSLLQVQELKSKIIHSVSETDSESLHNNPGGKIFFLEITCWYWPLGLFWI